MTARRLYPALAPSGGPPAPALVRVSAWQRMEIEGARKLLMDVPGLLDAGKPEAYVVGLVEGAAANLLDILDAITEVA